MKNEIDQFFSQNKYDNQIEWLKKPWFLLVGGHWSSWIIEFFSAKYYVNKHCLILRNVRLVLWSYFLFVLAWVKNVVKTLLSF
jgi:hypothetical protein